MNQKSKTSSSVLTILLIIIAFFAGLFIGLVVLGWGLWPVTWTGASFETLNSADQQVFLRAAIESYAYNPDETVAQQRYAALGDQKEKILSDILVNPGNLEKEEVEKFADAIKVSPAPLTTTEAVTTSVPMPAPAKSVVSSLLNMASNRSSLTDICLPVALLIGLVLVILIVILSRRKKKSKETGEQPIEQLKPVETGALAEISSSGLSGEVPSGGATTTSIAREDTAIPMETELPDWLREASPENQPAPSESKTETPAVELSDSDIKEITTSEFSTLESKPPTSLDSSELNQALASSSAFVPDGSDKPVEPVPQPVKSETQTEPAAKAALFQETKEETLAKFSREIELTPGIDLENAKKLRSIGITAPLLLLKKGATPRGRQAIAAGLGIPEMQVLKWVNSIDLLRIKGLTIEDAQMLKAAGVDILVELATRDPESLLEKLAAAKSTNPSYKTPDLDQIQSWITQARELPRIIAYS
jgi:hypothetical protein